MAVRTINTNLEITRFTNRANVSQVDAFSLLDNKPERQFDYIFIAPPQYKDMWKRALFCLDKNPEWLTHDAWVLVQIQPVEYESINLSNLVEFDQRKYGSTVLIFYERPNAESV
jgi:16S rRNA G966 N2-methylase RsmD